MPAPDAVSRQKREAILDAAGQVFVEQGYEGASMSEITRLAKVSKSTVYNHFNSKAELFGAFVRRGCETILDPIFDEPAPDRDPADTLRLLGTGIVSAILSPLWFNIDRIVSSEAERFPELAQAFFAAGPQPVVTTTARWLAEQVELGRFEIDDCVFAAEQFFMLCQTRLVAHRKLMLPLPPGLTLPDIVERAVAVFVQAYAIRGYRSARSAPS